MTILYHNSLMHKSCILLRRQRNRHDTYIFETKAISGWAWYRSDANGWVRVGDAVAGCLF
ncbi:hypothetical protein FPK29_02655 [Bifidobacterium polysaccharolyticum]|uniref:Uncharacterized protein n=1 Tax=Bifidobacterium asteroides TaxID=1684 RepID=A0A556RCH5_9BIFI|nr:hypothetical protein FPK29_02655 [Bifidobacterium polysaccharolyticum]